MPLTLSSLERRNLWSQQYLRTEPGLVLLAFVELLWIYIKVNEISPLASLASSLEHGYNLIWSLKRSSFGQWLPLPIRMYTSRSPNPRCPPRSWFHAGHFTARRKIVWVLFSNIYNLGNAGSCSVQVFLLWQISFFIHLLIQYSRIIWLSLGKNQQLENLQKKRAFPRKISPQVRRKLQWPKKHRIRVDWTGRAWDSRYS